MRGHAVVLVRTTRLEGKHVMRANLYDDCEVAVIGAGPYGLAVAAHLRAADVSTRVFGRTLSFWRENMPKGMRLRSPWIATHIADPDNKFSLDAFARRVALARCEQLPLEQFVQYGEWFQSQAVPDLESRRVKRVESLGPGFRLRLEDDHTVHARRVVVAMGLAHQEWRPPPFEGIDGSLVSHSCEHAALDKWSGKRVAVIGRGQSACESAALLRRAGAEVDLLCRGEVHWIGADPAQPVRERDWLWWLRELLQAPSAVGPFPWSWLNELPGWEHRLPASLRARIGARSLRAAATRWIMPGFDGVQVLAGRAIRSVKNEGARVAIELDDATRHYDHVLLGTGYRIDIAKLGILSAELIGNIARSGGSPVLSAGFESNVPGLHFAGASAVASFGPLMRFIAGAGYAARSITRTVLAARGREKLAALMARASYPVGSAQHISRP
jgi:cation diffusion facilitator CzcD-associated flavoprotein CzcO